MNATSQKFIWDVDMTLTSGISITMSTMALTWNECEALLAELREEGVVIDCVNYNIEFLKRACRV